jgi:hypothetical protein
VDEVTGTIIKIFLGFFLFSSKYYIDALKASTVLCRFSNPHSLPVYAYPDPTYQTIADPVPNLIPDPSPALNLASFSKM